MRMGIDAFLSDLLRSYFIRNITSFGLDRNEDSMLRAQSDCSAPEIWLHSRVYEAGLESPSPISTLLFCFDSAAILSLTIPRFFSLYLLSTR